MKIIAHTLIKNEENFVWFAVNSIIDYVDEILIWDQGSSDKTKEIIETIRSSKIRFCEVGGSVSSARQKMLDESHGFDWIFILDGDEIWWDEAIKNLKLKIINSAYDVVVVPNYMLVGDVFHFQEEKAGKYQIAGRTGHYNIRAIRNFPGLHLEGIYPNEAFVNKDGVKVQDFPKEKILFYDKPYLHASFLKKRKYEIGESFPKDFYYPEVFFLPRPSIVSSPWQPMTKDYKLRASVETPLKKIKRRLL